MVCSRASCLRPLYGIAVGLLVCLRPLYGIAVGLLGMFKTFVWYCSRASGYV